MNLLKKFIFHIKKVFGFTAIIIFLFTTFSTYSNQCLAVENSMAEKLFIEHCSGCHVNGGNIVRRNKNLKITTLKRNGLDNPEAIAKVAREGIGSMSGYANVLSEQEVEIIANWILEQAQKAWTQG